MRSKLKVFRVKQEGDWTSYKVLSQEGAVLASGKRRDTAKGTIEHYHSYCVRNDCEVEDVNN